MGQGSIITSTANMIFEIMIIMKIMVSVVKVLKI